MKEVLILGIGNVLFNDAGVGAHIIQMLKMLGVPAGVELLDAGVGANLTPDVLCGYKLLVVIDAAKGHLPAGTVRRITPHYNADCVALMSMQKDELNEIFNLLKTQETSSASLWQNGTVSVMYHSRIKTKSTSNTIAS